MGQIQIPCDILTFSHSLDPKPTSEAAENEARNGKFCPIRDVRVDE
jgi:hypothetical protein